jgi:hypothetical protein
MTEDEWRTSRHGPQMLAFVQTATVPVRTRWLGWMEARRFPVSERKIRLVEVACCDRVADLVPLASVRSLIEVARQQDEAGAVLVQEAGRLPGGVYATSTPAERLAIDAVVRFYERASCRGGDVLVLAARARAEAVAGQSPSGVYERQWHDALADEQAAQADLVRDAIGNPFRREAVDLAWLVANDRAALRIAEGGTFADLPILADALEDAGCTSRAILDHCRGPGPHVVGCWVVDAILGRE